MQLKKYPIELFGDKTKTVRKKHKIQYISPIQFEQQQNANICGYTDLRLRKNKKHNEPIGVLSDNESDISYVYSTRSKTAAIKGYIKLKDTENKYIAITSNSILPWLLILLALLLLILISILSFCNKQHPGSPIFRPNIEHNTGANEETQENEARGIQVRGFTTWSIPANTSKNLSIPLENPEGNPCYFSFEILLSDTGEVIYSSDMVPPGEKISRINITREFDAGDYPATIKIKTNELITGKEMNSPAIQIIIHVS